MSDVVWYHIPTDTIFLSREVEAYFFELSRLIVWEELLILGDL